MADFSTTNLGESPSAPSVRSPVTTLDTAIAQGIADTAGAVNDLTAGFRARRASALASAKYQHTLDQDEKEDTTTRAVNNAFTSLSTQAQAEGWSSSKTQLQLNLLTTDMFNNPEYDPKVVSLALKDFRGGRGKESLEPTAAEKFEIKVKERALEFGVSEASARAMMNAEYATTNLLTRKQALANLDQIDRDRQTYTLDYNQAEYIQASAGAFTAGIQEDISQNGEILANLPAEEAAARVRSLEQSAIEFEKQLRNSIADGEGFTSTSKAIESQLALVESQLGIYKDLVLGTTTLEVATARLDNANAEDQLRARAIIEGGPNGQLNRDTLGLVGIFGRNGIAVENLAMEVAGSLYESVKNGTSRGPIQPNSLDTLVKTAETNPSYTPEEKKGVAQTLVDMSGELALYHDFPHHDTEEAGKNRQSILRAYAAPRVGKFLEDNEVVLPASVQRRHKAMQSSHLHDVLLPAIEQDWHRGVSSPKGGGGVDIKKGKNHAKMDIGSDGLIKFSPLDSESDPVVAQSLNNKVALLLNEWIRGSSHFTGSTDYTLWMQNAEDVQSINELFKAAAE